jgi:hypothetical protein
MAYCLPAGRLHKEVEAFVNWISPTPVEDEVRGMIVTLVSKAVTSAFPDAQVLPFGSFGTKLYLPLGYFVYSFVIFRVSLMLYCCFQRYRPRNSVRLDGLQ